MDFRLRTNTYCILLIHNALHAKAILAFYKIFYEVLNINRRKK